ncbi:MAG TPA: TolC family protein [Gemmatimonadaceae bacterium]|nr:TolC family protein [Gemmatimonadaceae bacterium]
MKAHCTIALAAALTLSSAARAQDDKQSLSLGDAARVAAERGAQVTIAREQVTQANARTRQLRADLLPSVTAGGKADARTVNTAALGFDFPTAPGQQPIFDSNGEVIGPNRSVDLRLRAEQTVLDLQAIRRWRAAGVNAGAARYNAAAVADVAAEQGALAYLQVLSAEARLHARIADSALAEELLSIARRQFAAGTAVALDVTRAEAQVATAIEQLIATRSDRDQARLNLTRVLSLPVDTPIEMTDSLAHPSKDALPEIGAPEVQAALTRRSDIRAAEATAYAARQSVRAANAQYLPTISLFADQGSIGSDVDNLRNTYTYGVIISVPVLDGLRRSSQVDEQRSIRREAETRWRDLQLQAEVEVRSATIELRAARERVTAADARLRLAEQELNQARDRFRAGVASNADVITASVSLNGARDLVVDALTAFHVARVALASAQGTITTMK